METITVKSDVKGFFHNYLTMKKTYLEIVLSKIHGTKIVLSPKILSVFSLFLYYNYTNGIEAGVLWNKQIKTLIEKELEISSPQLNTYISVMRKLKLFNDNHINKPFIVKPGSEFDLVFKFIINEE